MDPGLAATTAEQNLSILSLIIDASLLVQMVMVILLAASVVSWTMIFSKYVSIKAERKTADRFEEDFWSGGDMAGLYSDWSGRRKQANGMAAIFLSGYREYSRLSDRGNIDRGDMLDGVHRAMRVELGREIELLETHLSFLATVGSTSPYIGLFGTVWGIMNSFRSLGVAQQATIASVAPGIAEALVATAMGLFAAIPAVIAYNRFSNDVERLISRYEVFTEEFLSIVNRQIAS